MRKRTSVVGLAIIVVAAGAGAVAGCGGAGLATMPPPVWTAESQLIDVRCGDFFSGSMRFSATRDQLSPDQLAMLSNLRVIPAATGCLEDGRSCGITVTDQAGHQTKFDMLELDLACGDARPVVSFDSFQPFMQSLGCQYAKNLTYGPASPVAADARCYNGLFTSPDGGSSTVTLVGDAQAARHIELDDCDQAGRVGKLAFTLLDSDGTTALGTGAAVADPGPNHTCVALDITFPRAGQYPLTVVAGAGIMPAGDFSLHFY
jgi:hypothetical protein